MREYENIKAETIEEAHKPYDVVTDKAGNVGFIQEVNLNDCQTHPYQQVSYAVNWLVGRGDKHAWYHTEDLEVHTNIFKEIAKSSCHAMGHSANAVDVLFTTFK